MNEHDVHVPRNPQEAINQANRLQRARQIIKDGYTFTQEPSGMVAVCKPGELFASYWIGEHVDGTNGCDCPDRAKGNVCKHEIAWSLIQKREADELAGLEAQCKQWEQEEGWADIPNSRLHRMRDLLHAELLEAENTAARLNSEPFCCKDAVKSWMRKAQRCLIALHQFDETLCKVQIGRLTL